MKKQEEKLTNKKLAAVRSTAVKFKHHKVLSSLNKKSFNFLTNLKHQKLAGWLLQSLIEFVQLEFEHYNFQVKIQLINLLCDACYPVLHSRSTCINMDCRRDSLRVSMNSTTLCVCFNINACVIIEIGFNLESGRFIHCNWVNVRLMLALKI